MRRAVYLVQIFAFLLAISQPALADLEATKDLSAAQALRAQAGSTLDRENQNIKDKKDKGQPITDEDIKKQQAALENFRQAQAKEQQALNRYKLAHPDAKIETPSAPGSTPSSNASAQNPANPNVKPDNIPAHSADPKLRRDYYEKTGWYQGPDGNYYHAGDPKGWQKAASDGNATAQQIVDNNVRVWANDRLQNPAGTLTAPNNQSFHTWGDSKGTLYAYARPEGGTGALTPVTYNSATNQYSTPNGVPVSSSAFHPAPTSTGATPAPVPAAESAVQTAATSGGGGGSAPLPADVPAKLTVPNNPPVAQNAAPTANPAKPQNPPQVALDPFESAFSYKPQTAPLSGTVGQSSDPCAYGRCPVKLTPTPQPDKIVDTRNLTPITDAQAKKFPTVE